MNTPTEPCTPPTEPTPPSPLKMSDCQVGMLVEWEQLDRHSQKIQHRSGRITELIGRYTIKIGPEWLWHPDLLNLREQSPAPTTDTVTPIQPA